MLELKSSDSTKEIAAGKNEQPLIESEVNKYITIV